MKNSHETIQTERVTSLKFEGKTANPIFVLSKNILEMVGK